MFLGEYDCKLDAKGRIILPSGLKKKLPDSAPRRFVINRGFERCLVLYQYPHWETLSTRINALNFFNKKNRAFARYFFRGATELTMDAQSRILIPKTLLEYAGISADISLLAYDDKVEIWNKGIYTDLLDNEPEDFSTLAEEVMGS